MCGGVVFEDVSFAYPGNRRLVLDRLNLAIGIGERIALVGANGQGKTTIVKLLARQYDPTAGRILLDGVDLRDYRVEDLHREFGVIFQDFMRYDMTARQNIAVGRIEIEARNDEIELAARKSLANAVISRLPHGYDQVLGRRFEGGVDLSGGEWQKIALARAYLRDAQILVLDEPTAALDARAEYEVFERFAELTAGKTALLISHRFSTVRMADRIVVLADGRIAEQGSHKDLLRRGGRVRGNVRAAGSQLPLISWAGRRKRAIRRGRLSGPPLLILSARPRMSRRRWTTPAPVAVRRRERSGPLSRGRGFVGSVKRHIRSLRRVIYSGIAAHPAPRPHRHWLAENGRLIAATVKETAELAGGTRTLPAVGPDPSAAVLRVVALANAFLDHVDSRFDEERFVAFLQGAQEVGDLTLGEIWATVLRCSSR